MFEHNTNCLIVNSADPELLKEIRSWFTVKTLKKKKQIIKTISVQNELADVPTLFGEPITKERFTGETTITITLKGNFYDRTSSNFKSRQSA